MINKNVGFNLSSDFFKKITARLLYVPQNKLPSKFSPLLPPSSRVPPSATQAPPPPPTQHPAPPSSTLCCHWSSIVELYWPR